MKHKVARTAARIMFSRKGTHALMMGFLLACLVSAQGQVVATQRAGFGLPANQVAAPNTPGGGVVVGSNVYATDQVWGLRHYTPADATNPDPVNTGILIFDNVNDGTNVGGTELCIFFCKAGQAAYDGNQTVFLPSYDQAKGQPGSLTFPGVHRITIDPLTGQAQWNYRLVPNAGLGGNLPVAIALGPDGNLYVGFIKNGNVVRITKPFVDPSNDPNKTQVVQSVGTSPNGRPINSLSFAGPDLYVATTDSFSVIKNAVATTCQGGCNAVPIADGFAGTAHVGLASDGINRVYVSINGRGVWRFTINTQSMTPVANGGVDPNGVFLPFAFVSNRSNVLQLDRLGNLWIGDDISDGRLSFDGRLFYISAGQLATIP
ncbi:MAG TPA: hypothetical protein VF532_03340 [Candidatus Angelobacter sp.]